MDIFLDWASASCCLVCSALRCCEYIIGDLEVGRGEESRERGERKEGKEGKSEEKKLRERGRGEGGRRKEGGEGGREGAVLLARYRRYRIEWAIGVGVGWIGSDGFKGRIKQFCLKSNEYAIVLKFERESQ